MGITQLPCSPIAGIDVADDELVCGWRKEVQVSAAGERATNLSGTVTISVANVATNLTQLGDGRTVTHLINHNYAKGFQTQSAITVAFPMATSPTTVTLVSPDAKGDMEVPFTYANRQVQVTVPQLVAYTAVVAQ